MITIIVHLSGQSMFVNVLTPGGNLSDQFSVDLAVLDVLTEVLDESGTTGLEYVDHCQLLSETQRDFREYSS